jgi:UDP-N-acetylmuramyl pentapeptide synthase
MSRATDTDFPTAYRLVITRTMAGESYTEYVGPYQTIGAAKGQLTQELRERIYEHYEKKVGHIELLTGNWRKVKS